MEYRRYGKNYVLRLDRGDEIISSITSFAENENIRCATLQGLGAADHVDLALFDVASQTFHTRTLDEPLEISSVNGNITRKDGDVYLHLHITLCDADLKTWGGHLKNCRISVTAELFVTVIDGEVGRRYNETTGIYEFSY